TSSTRHRSSRASHSADSALFFKTTAGSPAARAISSAPASGRLLPTRTTRAGASGPRRCNKAARLLPRPEPNTATRMDIARKYNPRHLLAYTSVKPSEPDPRPHVPLHIRCGDDILGKLQAAGLEGDRTRWSDPVCEGPLHPWPTDQDRRRERA